MLSLLLAVFTAPFLFFLPGYFVSLLLPWVRGVAARLAVSLVTSVTLGVIVSSAAAFAGLPVGISLVISMALAAAASAAGAWQVRRTLIEEWKREARSGKILIIAVALLALAAAALVSVPHVNYPWPIHADEWWDVGVVQNTIDGYSPNTHPYLWNEFPNHKPGFTSYLAGVFDLWSVNPVRAWSALPGANVFLTTLIAALFTLSVTRGKPAPFEAGRPTAAVTASSARRLRTGWAALAVPVLLAAVRSNAYMLGWWFFVPSSFAPLFLLALLIPAADWFRSARGIVWAACIACALALVYAPFISFAGLALFPLAAARARRSCAQGSLVRASRCGGGRGIRDRDCGKSLCHLLDKGCRAGNFEGARGAGCGHRPFRGER